MRNAKRPHRGSDPELAKRAALMTEGYRRFERQAAIILTDRIEFARAADARDIAEWCGYRDSRSVYYQATGEQPLQYRTVSGLAIWDPEGARRIRQLEAEVHGEELRPAPQVLAQAPTLGDGLRGLLHREHGPGVRSPSGRPAHRGRGAATGGAVGDGGPQARDPARQLRAMAQAPAQVQPLRKAVSR